jgi:hypothetical protein
MNLKSSCPFLALQKNKCHIRYNHYTSGTRNVKQKPLDTESSRNNKATVPKIIAIIIIEPAGLQTATTTTTTKPFIPKQVRVG